MPQLGKKFSLGYVEMISRGSSASSWWPRSNSPLLLASSSFSDDRGVPEMSDAAAAGDVAIDPKAPFTPGLAGLDRYCRRDAQWANLGLLFDDAFSNTASAPYKSASCHCHA